MRLSTRIENLIMKNYKGRMFSTGDISSRLFREKISASRLTVSRAISKLKSEDKIRIVKGRSKGLYYVPKKGSLGFLKPEDKEILRKFTAENGYYISGVSLFNELNLTTQNAMFLKIKSSNMNYSKTIQTFNVRVKIVPSRAVINNSSVKYLKCLDALDIKKIPDFSPKSLTILISAVKNMNSYKLMEFSYKYPPRVRALLGAIIESESKSSKNKIEAFRSALVSKGSIYRMPIRKKDLPNYKDWRILPQ